MESKARFCGGKRGRTLTHTRQWWQEKGPQDPARLGLVTASRWARPVVRTQAELTSEAPVPRCCGVTPALSWWQLVGNSTCRGGSGRPGTGKPVLAWRVDAAFPAVGGVGCGPLLRAAPSTGRAGEAAPSPPSFLGSSSVLRKPGASSVGKARSKQALSPWGCRGETGLRGLRWRGAAAWLWQDTGPTARFLPSVCGQRGSAPQSLHPSSPGSPTQPISQTETPETPEVRSLSPGHRGGEHGGPSGPAARPRAILEGDGTLQASPRRAPRFLCCHRPLEPLLTSRRPAKSRCGVSTGPQGGEKEAEV
ncbi:uncharacterized protein RBU33_014384 [Hipposideros larvatus]